jgi:hypothetical protein
MPRFIIHNTISGHCFGLYDAESKENALDVLARDAGYDDYADMNSVTPAQDGEIFVEEIDERRRGYLNREQAIARVGERAVCDVEQWQPEPTGRVGYNGKRHGDSLCEWSASVDCDDTAPDLMLMAYYYTTNEQDELISNADGDGSVINWEIAGYTVE